MINMKTRIRKLTEQEKRSLGEQQMIADWLKIFPDGILSIVADTFDLWVFIMKYLVANKEAIMARNGKLVIRPDSGNPVDIISGLEKVCFITGNDSTDFEIRDYDFGDWWVNNSENPKWLVWNNRLFKYGREGYRKALLSSYKEYPYSEAIQKGVIELLWDIFGGTINKQDYKVLDPHIGAIYGDSITPERQRQIYERLAAKGFAATNIVLGIGSFTYQYNTRDTLGFAAKGAWFEVEENTCPNKTSCCEGQSPDCDNSFIKKSYNIYKDPVTDDGTKKSLKGLLCVVKDTEDLHDGEIYVEQECTPERESEGLLQVIYEDGKFYNTTTLTEIRERLLKQ